MPIRFLTELSSVSQSVQNLLYDHIKSIYEKHDYWFSEQPEEPNVFGIRSGFSATNKFDDNLGVAWIDQDGNKNAVFWPATTDPGFPYLKKVINIKGCAILAPGQYREAYQLGKHMGKYLALVQSGGPVKVFRDNNKDLNYDYDPKSIQSGKFGINIHKRTKETDSVDGASAGCQVFRFAKDFEVLIRICKTWSKKSKQNRFTYTLFGPGEFSVD